MSFLALSNFLHLSINAQDLIRLAEKNDSTYAVAVEKTKRAELEWWKSVAMLSPKLSAQATGSRNNKEIVFSPTDSIGLDQDNPMFSNAETAPVILQPLYDWNGAVNVTVPIVQSNTWWSLKSSKLIHKIATDDAYNQKILLQHRILTLYIQGLMMQDQAELAKQQADIAQQNATELKAARESGTATQIDLLQSELEHNRAQNRLQNSKTQLRRIIRAIERITKSKITTDLAPLKLTDINPIQEESLSEGLALNKTLQQSHSNIELKGVALNLQKTALLPSLQGQFTQVWMKNIAFSDERSTWSASLQLQWNVWDGGLTRQNAKSAEIDLAIANLEHSALTESIQEQIQSALEDLEDAEKATSEAALAVKLMATRLESMKSGLDSGSVTALEYNKMQLLHNETLLLESTAHYKHHLKRLDLWLAIGKSPLDLLAIEEKQP